MGDFQAKDEPEFVVTVLADEITRSPIHTCAQDEKGRGLALRFPRIVGFIREDKSPAMRP
jgi:DNA ligase-1